MPRKIPQIAVAAILTVGAARWISAADFRQWISESESAWGMQRKAAASGWIELPATRLLDVCPPNTAAYAFASSCHGIVQAWSGGIADSRRNHLIIWGGGHNDYYGNEIYALDVSARKLTRLNDPSPVNGAPPFHSPECIEALADGAPNSRHTYGGLAQIAHVDRMFVFSGSLACNGGGVGGDTWTLDLETLKWRRMDPTGNGNKHPNPLYFGAMADYDPVTKLVYVHDRGNALWSYSYERNVYIPLADTPPFDLGSAAVIDPKRRTFYVFGPAAKTHIPSLHAVQLGGNFATRDMTGEVSGCETLMGKDADNAGLAYDSALDRIVGWVNAGDTNSVYVFDVDAKKCTRVAYPGGPHLNAGVRGVFGRWRYFPQLDLFALVADATQNAFLFSLKPGYSTAASTTDSRPEVEAEKKPNDVSTTKRPERKRTLGAEPVVATAGAKGPYETIEVHSVAERPTDQPPKVPAGGQSAADADFAARCASPGVVRCYGFDDSADTEKHIRQSMNGNEKRIQVVSDVKASGTGSLRFTIPSQSGEGSGSFELNFSPDLSFQVGEGQEFYIQWRQRFSSSLLNTVFTNGEGWKQAIISDGDVRGHVADACTQLEIVLQNSGQAGAPQMYHSCGEKDGAYDPLTVYNTLRAPGRYEIQNGLNPPCIYHEVKNPPCVTYKPDQWMTFQIHVKVGTWYKNDRRYHQDSAVQLWVAYEGQRSKLVIDFSPKSDSGGYDLANQNPVNKYGKIWLLPYHTHKDPNQVHPVCYTWYDELIISHNRISDPGTAGRK